jgi:hypothetical protein
MCAVTFTLYDSNGRAFAFGCKGAYIAKWRSFGLAYRIQAEVCRVCGLPCGEGEHEHIACVEDEKKG